MRCAWVAWSVERQALGFSSGHDFMDYGIEPHIRLPTQQGVCLKILSLPLLPHSFSNKKNNMI